MINVKIENGIWKSIFFYFYFVVVHILTKNVLDGLKVWVHVNIISFGGTMSQIYTFFLYYFLTFIENEPGPIPKI